MWKNERLPAVGGKLAISLENHIRFYSAYIHIARKYVLVKLPCRKSHLTSPNVKNSQDVSQKNTAQDRHAAA